MKRISPEDFRRLESVSSLAGSPDGACAYAVYFWQDGMWRRRVELLAAGSSPEVITCGGSIEKDPAFSADGELLYFLSDGNVGVYERKKAQSRLFYQPEEGFEAYGFAVTPQGVSVKVRREIREEAPEGCEWEMPLVAENLRYRSDSDHGFAKVYERRLVLASEETVLLDEGSADWKNLTCADENTLIFGQGGWQKLDIPSREKTCLDANLIDAGALAAHGGRIIAAARSKTDYTLGLYDIRLSGESKPIDFSFDLPLADGAYCDKSPECKTQLSFTPDGSALAILTNGAVPGLWRLDDGKNLSEETIFECAPAGETCWVVRGGSHQPMEICTLENGRCIPQAAHNAWFSDISVPAYETLSVPSLDGKTTLHGFCIQPERSENAPVLLWIHGGPEGFYTDALWLEVQAAVSRGFAVILPNPRGSTGYGNAYQHSGQEFDQGACADVLTLLDAALRAHPQWDPSRVGVLGGSYGGYMSAMLAGTTKRFKAAVVMKPVTNWLFIHFKSSQSGQDVFSEHRDFQDFLCDMVRMSPIVHAGDVDIPTLIIHGQKDQQVPVENAHQFYVAVRDTHPDLPVRLIVMPDCCHGYSRDHADDYLFIQNQTLAWLEKYV
ncbi:MAG: S9 family peptidase [Clostridia bacterium]|nr:S9 family peptidase [Clostridia bacterium]